MIRKTKKTKPNIKIREWMTPFFKYGLVVFYGVVVIHRMGLTQTPVQPKVIQGNQIPVILDTDIGEDIDDTWALAFLLCSPELDLRLVTTSYNDTHAKALIAAKFLHRMGKSHIPVGVGIKTGNHKSYQYAWAEHFKKEEYAGEIHEDGIAAMLDTIRNATQTITIIVTGPATNIQELLRRDPAIVDRVKIVASMGSIHKGYDEIPTPDAEYNIRKDIQAAKTLFQAAWEITLAPLDVTGSIVIRSKEYQSLMEWITLVDRQEDEYSLDEVIELQRLRESDQLIRARESPVPYKLPLARKPKHTVIYSLIESYRAWLQESGVTIPADARSTILYDTVAVYLAFSNDLLEMKPLRLGIHFTGYTRIDPNGKQVFAALDWRDPAAFQAMIVNRLLAGLPIKPEEEAASQTTRFQRVRVTGSN